MDAPEHPLLKQLVAAVQANPKYRGIALSLVMRIGAAELSKGRGLKEAVKATRNKLHQVGGAYQESGIDYERWSAALAALPKEDPAALQDFCRRMMAQHASTRERLPALERIFRETLGSLAPVASVLDLACGLNPLAIPWMPLAEGAPYYACDIYAGMVSFLNTFLARLNRPGLVEICDLSQALPDRPVQLALLLKTLPCLEQIDKDIARPLLSGIRAEHLMVSFPAHSLGGHAKGMPVTYEAHFRELVAGCPWQVHRFEFPGELVFLIDK